MDFSTLIILTIATLIIVYRIKTWNDVQENAAPDESKGSTSATKTAPSTQTSKKARQPKKTESKANESLEIQYMKKYNGKMAKNRILVESVLHPDITATVMDFKGEPKKGTTTKVVLINDLDERAQGIIVESRKDQIVLVKSFDVKLAASGQFKVPTSFSKSQMIKVDELKEQNFEITHFLGHDETIYPLKNIFLELQ